MKVRLAGVLAFVFAATAGTATANPIPPQGLTVPGLMTKSAKDAAADAVPTFANGLAQNVFSSNSADWIRGEVWVETDFDSDGDGKPDRMHVDYTLPKETQSTGLKVPIIYEDSPYFAGTARSYSNWVVDHELGAAPPVRPFAPFWSATNTSPVISTDFDSAWLPRGFGVVHSESPGTGYSDGCPSSGGRNETLGASEVIEWLTGHRKAYSSRTGNTEVDATWSSGHVGMMGTSYNGTIPEAAATTGVQGLDAIVPISAISDWYDYYRANGMVRAPHSRAGGTGTNAYLGEDLDVLEDDVYSRIDETGDRLICRPQIVNTATQEDRLTGNRNAFWDERDYMKSVQNVHAAALLAHGNNDFNVMTKNAAQFYAALRAQGVPHEWYFHQGGHGGAPPDAMVNRWFTRYLYGVQNGVENLPKSWVVREAATCPARQTTVTGDQSNTATLTLTNTSAFMVGQTLTVQVTAANGSTSNVTSLINDIPDSKHLTLANAVATAAGSKVANGSIVSLACGNANPTPYAEWPDPSSATVVERFTAGGNSRGGLSFTGPYSTGTETLTDDASIDDVTLMNAAPSSVNRLVYQTPPLNQDVRISGTPSVDLKMAFSKPRANLSAALISYPAQGGSGTILTRGWLDPENRNSDYVSDPVVPGTFYSLHFDMQPKDAIVPAGNRLAVMVFSSDRNYTIRPAAGTQLTVDLASSSLNLPIVGGQPTLAAATGVATLNAGATVPTQLSLTLGSAVSFGSIVAGVGKDYLASTSASVLSTAGNASLSVMDTSGNATGHLVNGDFTLAQPLQVQANGQTAYQSITNTPTQLMTWSAPVTNDPVTLNFKQTVGAGEALRAGTYSKSLTFTVSTTTP